MASEADELLVMVLLLREKDSRCAYDCWWWVYF
jgi:hypothetical protein